MLRLPTRTIALAVTVWLMALSTGVAAITALQSSAATLHSSTAMLSSSAFYKVVHMPLKAKIKMGPVALDRLAQFRNATKLTGVQLAALLKEVGFDGAALKTAWAVAMRESHGHPTSHNTNLYTGDDSYGLFQVNMIGAMGAGRRVWLGIQHNAQLLDPVTNVQAVYRMTHGGQDWGSWGLGPNAYRGAADPETVARWLPLFPTAEHEY